MGSGGLKAMFSENEGSALEQKFSKMNEAGDGEAAPAAKPEE
jgi:hypothetical protein